MYLGGAWILYVMADGFLKDYNVVSCRHGYSLFKKWTPEFIAVSILVAYIVGAVNHLASMDWGGP